MISAGVVEAFVARTTAASGVPERVEDPAVVAQVAEVLAMPTSAKQPARRTPAASSPKRPSPRKARHEQ